ncbi:MAG: retropepsin-like aspartic protease [Ferruginibacter sp.]
MKLRRNYINFLLLFAFLFNGAISVAAPPYKHPFPHNHNPSIQFYPSALSADSLSCTIPFSRAGNLILIQAKVDSVEGNFILDTGAPYLVLNITYFRNYPTTSTDGEQTSITGDGMTGARTTIDHLTLGAFNYFKVQADLINLGHIEKSKNVKIIGLLGLELFRQCEMIVDYEKNLLYLHTIGKKESNTYRHQMLDDTTTYRMLPFDFKDNRIISTAEVAGKKLKFIIDYGAESNILDSRLPDRIFENVTITGHVNLMGSENKKIDALYGDLKHIKIGNEEIASLSVMIVNLQNTCFSGMGCIDGVLGFDFLSLHKIGFNFVKHKMYIWK